MHSGGSNAIPGDRISIFRREFCWHYKGIRKASLKGLFGPVGGKRRAKIPHLQSEDRRIPRQVHGIGQFEVVLNVVPEGTDRIEPAHEKLHTKSRNPHFLGLRLQRIEVSYRFRYGPMNRSEWHVRNIHTPHTGLI